MTSAGSVLAALLANGAWPAIFEAVSENKADSPFTFQSRDILGVGSGGPVRMISQFALAMTGTLRRASRGLSNGLRLHKGSRPSRSIIPQVLFD
jgi:hypothetical protein